MTALDKLAELAKTYNHERAQAEMERDRYRDLVERAADLLRACDEELSGKWYERRDQWLSDARVKK